MENTDNNNENVLDDVRQVTEILTDLKIKQTNLINSINGLTLAEEEAQIALDAKKKELKDLDENSIRDLTQKINELNSLKTEKEIILSDVQGQIVSANKKLESVNLELSQVTGKVKDVLMSVDVEAGKIKENARVKVAELEAQKRSIESEITALNISKNYLEELIPSYNREIIELKKERDSLLSEITSLSEQLKTIQGQLNDETQALFEIQRKAETIIQRAKSAEELLSQEATLKDSVESLKVEIDNLKEDKQAIAVTKEERIAFEKEKYGIRVRDAELNQRIEFIKGVYQDFQIPW